MHDNSSRNHFPRPWRRAIHALDQALDVNAPRDNSELLDVIGRKHFGELWDLRPGDPMPDLKSIN